MAVESATYVNQLNETLPTNTDPISEGDNHLRLIKQVLKNTFPNIGGQVTLSDSDLNNAAIRSASLTSGALVKADASGKLVSSYNEADVPRRNQAETIPGRWVFETGGVVIRDSSSSQAILLELSTDDQSVYAISMKNATYGGPGVLVVQEDTGDALIDLRSSTNSVSVRLTLKQDGSASFSGRLDAPTIYENNLRVLAQMNSGRLAGRTSSGAGQWEEISAGSGLSLSAGVLDAKARFTVQETGSLTSGTVYQNTTGRPMFVNAMTSNSSGENIIAYCDSSSTPTTKVSQNETLGLASVSFLVPPDYYYKVVQSFGRAITYARWY